MIDEALKEYNEKFNSFGVEIDKSRFNDIRRQVEESLSLDYPEIRTALDIDRLMSAKILISAVRKYKTVSVIDIIASTSDKNKFALSLNNSCEKGCSNCAADAKRNGAVLAFDRIKSLDERYFELYEGVDFGLEGEPFFYMDGESDLADVIALLMSKGVKKFGILTGGFFQDNRIYSGVVGKLERMMGEIDLGVELTYNHYAGSAERNERSLAYTLELLGVLGVPIRIKVLGDNEGGNTDLKRTKESLLKYLDALGFYQDETGFGGMLNDYVVRLKPLVSSLSFPMGRYRPDLQKAEAMEDVEVRDVKKRGGILPVCDHLTYQQVFINLEGGLRFCPRIIAYDKPVVTNVYEKSFDEVMADMDEYHRINYEWLSENLDALVVGTKASCLCSRSAQLIGGTENVGR